MTLRRYYRHVMARNAAMRHIAAEYGVYFHWTTGPYTDGTTYQSVYAFHPTPGDRVGDILACGVGPTKLRALFDLHRRLKGRPDVWDRWFSMVLEVIETGRSAVGSAVGPDAPSV